MAEPDWSPDTGGRSLAEILREAGIENASRQSRRRKWDDPDEAGLRQRRAEAAAAERDGYGRRKSDLSFDEPPPPLRDSTPPPPRAAAALRDAAPLRDSAPPVERRQRPRRPPDPSTAAIPGLRPDRKPGVPGAGAMPSGPVPSGPVHSGSWHTGPVSSGATAQRAPQRSPQRASDPTVPPRSARDDEHFSTGPIPVVRPEDLQDDDATPRESALAWLRFAGELLIALAAGIGIYFTATLLWDNVPYLAVLLVPVAVTGLVSGVGAWRQRQGREPVGPRLLAVLVIAGTLLTIAPAAGLLASA
jgi:hypothetical protein